MMVVADHMRWRRRTSQCKRNYPTTNTMGDGPYIEPHVINAMPDSNYHAMLMIGRNAKATKLN